MIALVVSAWASTSGRREALGHLQRGFDPLHAELGVPAEEQEPPELRRERGQIGVRLLAGKQLVRLVHSLEAVLELAEVPHDLREAGGDPGRRVRRIRPLVELDRALEADLRLLAARAVSAPSSPRARAAPPARERRRSSPAARSKARCASAVAASDAARSAARTSISRARSRISAGIGRIGGRLERVDQVLGDDLDDLVLVAARQRERGTRRSRDASPCAPCATACRRRRA